jgi:tryptophanase
MKRWTRSTCGTGSRRRRFWGITEGVPIVQPPGGHAIYLDARAFLPHIPVSQFPGVALAVELYLEGGIRSVEIGSLMFGEHATMDLVRLAIPRRVYTQSHIEYVVEDVL